MKLAFANKIRQLRILKNYSVKEVAYFLEIDASTYHRLETGKSANWLKYLPKLLELYQMNEEQLFLGLPQEVIARKASETKKTEDSYIIQFFQQEIQKRDDLLNALKGDFAQLTAQNEEQYLEIKLLRKHA